MGVCLFSQLLSFETPFLFNVFIGLSTTNTFSARTLFNSNFNAHNYIFDNDRLREIIDPTSVILSTAL